MVCDEPLFRFGPSLVEVMQLQSVQSPLCPQIAWLLMNIINGIAMLDYLTPNEHVVAVFS